MELILKRPDCDVELICKYIQQFRRSLLLPSSGKTREINHISKFQKNKKI